VFEMRSFSTPTSETKATELAFKLMSDGNVGYLSDKLDCWAFSKK